MRYAPFPARLLAAAALLLSAGALAASPDDTDPSPEAAQALVRSTTEQVLAAVERERAAIEADPSRAWALVDELVSPLVDQQRVARWVLGRHWRLASPEQRERFIDEFRLLVLRTYATALTSFTGVEVRYLPLRPGRRRDEVTVRTQIPLRGARSIEVSYRLHYVGGHWRVFDVSIDGISLVSTYRSTFSALVKRGGIEGLLESLSAKNRAVAEAASRS